jgi:hypothetical protein
MENPNEKRCIAAEMDDNIDETDRAAERAEQAYEDSLLRSVGAL